MQSDYISREAAIIEMMDNDVDHAQGTDGREVVQILMDITAADVIPVAEIYDAGHKGKEVQFRIGGRLFAIRELAQ